MEQSKKDFLLGAAVGALAGGSVAALYLQKPRGSAPSAMLPSGAVKGSDLAARMIEHAALVAAADQWASQADERGVRLGGGEIISMYKSRVGSVPRSIVQWTRKQMDRWIEIGGLRWAESQVSMGTPVNTLAYLWIMEVLGHGVGLWESFRVYPKPPHSETPYHQFRKF